MPNINIELTEAEFNEVKRYKPDGYSWKDYIFSAGWVLARLKGEPFTEWKLSSGGTYPVEKPCRSTGYCPYGQMVEMFPFRTPKDNISCWPFGHSCPAFYMSELIVDRQHEKVKKETSDTPEEHPPEEEPVKNS